MTPADQHALREALADEAVTRFCHDCEQVHRKLNDEEVWLIQGFARGPYIALAAEAENTRLKETVEAALKKAFDAGFDISAEGWNAEYGCYDQENDAGYQTARDCAARSVLATIPPKENP